MDLISYTDRMPHIGETIKGHSFHSSFGGKGANQAVQAAKLNHRQPNTSLVDPIPVRIITKLGEDFFGKQTLENFQQQGVDTSHVLTTSKASSGVAPIIVDKNGHNCIIIVGGANDLLTIDEVNNASELITSSKILLTQLELPPLITLEALKIAKTSGVMTILNPAPVPPGIATQADLKDSLFQYTNLLCPNEPELQMLTGATITDIDSAKLAATGLIQHYPHLNILITLGAQGSLLVLYEEKEVKSFHFPATKVEKVVDTTGAGDSFLGSLAFFLASGKSLPEAIPLANSVAAVSVQSPGTQISYPSAFDLPALFS